MTIIPYSIHIPDENLETIRRQLALATIGYAPDDDGDWHYGTDARYLGE